MSTPSFRSSTLKVRPYICDACLLRHTVKRPSRRGIHQRTLEKRLMAEWDWKDRAKKIEAGKEKSVLSILEERGFVKQVAGDRGRDGLDSLINGKRIGAYVGVDPTAPSMHIGHMLPFMALFWMYIYGLRGVTVLGGGTAAVGDPSGRTTARQAQTSATRRANIMSMHYQLKKLWMNVEALQRKHKYESGWAWKRDVLNNSTWLKKTSIVEVLKDMGGGMRLGELLSRDSVKIRQESGEGMSLAEFSYPLLQAWDWWHMYLSMSVQVQIGGSDQFGNIVSGINAVNHMRKNTRDVNITAEQEKNEAMMRPMGFTVPLLTTASGEKLGKSAGNAIWLDPEMTSSFDLYRYFVSTSDADVERYLKLFTFIPLDSITETMTRHAEDPSKRFAQHLLAREFLELVHGAEAAAKTQKEHRAQFSRSTPLTLSSVLDFANDTTTPSEPTKGAYEQQPGPKFLTSKPQNPTATKYTYATPSLNEHAKQTNSNNASSKNITLPSSLVLNQPFARILWSAGLVSSKSEAQRLVQNHGAYVGALPGGHGQLGDEVSWTPVKSNQAEEAMKFVIDAGEEGRLMIFRVGKWNLRIVRIVDDGVFDETLKIGDEGPPGWADVAWKREQKRPRGGRHASKGMFEDGAKAAATAV